MSALNMVMSVIDPADVGVECPTKATRGASHRLHTGHVLFTALLALGVLGVVIGWQKRLPQVGERFGDLSRRRRVLTVMLFPVGILVIAAASGVLWAGIRSGEQGYTATLRMAWLSLTICGFTYLLVLGVVRLLRRGGPRHVGEDSIRLSEALSGRRASHEPVAPGPRMTDDGGLEAFVERESAQALHTHRWFVRQRLGVRLLVAVSIAALFTGVAAVMYYGFAKYSDEPIGPSFWVPLTAVGLITLAMSIPAAVNPVRYVRAIVRAGGCSRPVHPDTAYGRGAIAPTGTGTRTSAPPRRRSQGVHVRICRREA